MACLGLLVSSCLRYRNFILFALSPMPLLCQETGIKSGPGLPLDVMLDIRAQLTITPTPTQFLVLTFEIQYNSHA
jgi:hypothetical protein